MEGAAHSGVLGALPGEQHGEAAVGHGPGDDVRCGPSSGERLQARAEVPGYDCAMLEGSPCCGEREPSIHCGQLSQREQLPGLLAQCLLRPRREWPQHRPVGGGRAGFRRGCLLHDDVRVGAADSERRHGGAARPLGLGPRLGLGEQRDRARGPVDVRRRRVDVQRPRHHAVPHGEHHLDHPGDSGGGLGVAEVGLD